MAMITENTEYPDTDISPVTSRRWDDPCNYAATGTVGGEEFYDMPMDEDYEFMGNDALSMSNILYNSPFASNGIESFGGESSSLGFPEQDAHKSIFKDNSPYAPLDNINSYEILSHKPAGKDMVNHSNDEIFMRLGGNSTWQEALNPGLIYVDPKRLYEDESSMMMNIENPEDDYDDDEDEDDDNEYDDDDLYSPADVTYSPEGPLISASSSSSLYSDVPSNGATPSSFVATDSPDNAFPHQHETEVAHDMIDNVSAASESPVPSSKLNSSKHRKLAAVGPHRCEIVNSSTGRSCNKVFSRPYDLIRHQDTIHAPVRKTFKCEICGDNSKTTFSRMDALSRHIRVKHSSKHP